MSKDDHVSEFARLRKQAKRWLKQIHGGEPEAVTRLDRWLPGRKGRPVLRQVQQALAREQGFASWADLKEHHSLPDPSHGGRAALLDTFLEHACIFSGPADFAEKFRRAERIRARNPEIASASIHAAVVCGELDHVAGLLRANPQLVHAEGGPQRWQPLLFACYGRLPHARARAHGLDMARLLLDAGADPNAHFVTQDDWRLRFDALTGVMGQGELGQPEHPQADALARLLLERGADPNPGQGLYNTHLSGDDTRWLTLLFSFGLGPDAPISWHTDMSVAEKTGSARDGKLSRVLDYLVAQAAARGDEKRLALLLEHGADPDARSQYNRKTCYELARIAGHTRACALLLQHGATEAPLEGHDAFVEAATVGDRERARRLLAEHPEYLHDSGPLAEAALRGRVEAVRTFLALGLDPNRPNVHGNLALHNACEHAEIVDLLLEHGADPRARCHGGTACGWALHAGNHDMARRHAEHSRSLLDACTCGHLDLARELLSADPSCVAERTPAGSGPLHLLCDDEAQAEELIALLLAHGADPDLVNDHGHTPVQTLELRGADQVADLLEAMRDA